MGRTKAREVVFKLVFELCFINTEDSNLYEDFLNENNFDEDNTNFIKDMYLGIIEKYDELMEIISNNIENYTMERLFKVDLALLIMATFELIYYKKTPISVVANEAVELAKKYSTDKSYSFINGVISKIAKNIKE